MKNWRSKSLLISGDKKNYRKKKKKEDEKKNVYELGRMATA